MLSGKSKLYNILSVNTHPWVIYYNAVSIYLASLFHLIYSITARVILQEVVGGLRRTASQIFGFLSRRFGGRTGGSPGFVENVDFTRPNQVGVRIFHNVCLQLSIYIIGSDFQLIQYWWYSTEVDSHQRSCHFPIARSCYCSTNHNILFGIQYCLLNTKNKNDRRVDKRILKRTIN